MRKVITILGRKRGAEVTIDEAIEKLEEIAAEEEREAEAWRACVTLPDGNALENECNDQAKDIRQLAEWLKELKVYWKREQKEIRNRCPMV